MRSQIEVNGAPGARPSHRAANVQISVIVVSRPRRAQTISLFDCPPLSQCECGAKRCSYPKEFGIVLEPAGKRADCPERTHEPDCDRQRSRKSSHCSPFLGRGWSKHS